MAEGIQNWRRATAALLVGLAAGCGGGGDTTVGTEAVASRPAGYEPTAVAVPPFQPGARATLIGDADDLFLFGETGQLRGARYSQGRWEDLPALELVAVDLVLAGESPIAVGLRCGDDACEDGEIAIARLDSGTSSWTVETTGEKRRTEVFSVKAIGEALGGTAFFVGPELWIVDANDGFEKAASPHFPWELCSVDASVVAAEPRRDVSDEDSMESPALERLALRQLIDGSWVDLGTPPSDAAGPVAPVCLSDGIAFVGGDHTTTWRAGQWETTQAAPPARVSSQDVLPVPGGLVALAADGVLYRFALSTGWSRLAEVALREPHLTVLGRFGGDVAILDPGHAGENSPKITVVEGAAE